MIKEAVPTIYWKCPHCGHIINHNLSEKALNQGVICICEQQMSFPMVKLSVEKRKKPLHTPPKQPTLPQNTKEKVLEGEQIEAYHKIQEWLSTTEDFINKNTDITLNEELITNNLYFLLSGQAGTGKTYTTEVILKDHPVTIYSTPTHQSKNVLQANIQAGHRAITIQSLLGLFPLINEGKEVFVAKSIEEIKDLFHEDEKLPEIFSHSFIVIDEASQLGGGPLPEAKEKKVWNDYKKRYENPMVHINPPLGTYLTEMIRLKHELTGVLTKVFFMGDIVQTVPVGTEPYHVSKILEDIQRSGNYAQLEKVRRVSPDKVDILNLHSKLRENFYNIYNNGTRTSLRDILTEANYNNENLIALKEPEDMVHYFIKHYKETLESPEPNPQYTSIINYNNFKHKRTVNLTRMVRQTLFPNTDHNTLNNNELIINRSTIKYRYDDKSFSTGPDTKMIVLSYHNTNKNVIDNDGNLIEKVPIIKATVMINDPINGIIKTEVELMHDLTREAIINYWKKSKSFLSHLPPKDVMTISKAISDYEYGYVINNYKVQGSGINYPIIHADNIMGSPTDPLHKTTFMYTAVSRVKDKLYIYTIHHKLKEME